ncbi:MAG: hydantoinase/oxoprolinase family protein [Firmicutes bacterium]|nr:hydantoinase/oxoprolinase family protein [Bacillota bacterium]
MLIGIDVGGTFTDAVLIDQGRPVRKAKIPTAPDLIPCLLGALDEVTRGIEPHQIERVTLSTTLITNLIAEEKTDPVVILLIPGPGVNPASYHLPGKAYVLKGAIDYRGRETAPLDYDELKRVTAEIAQSGPRKVAIVGKFSPRNHTHEDQIADYIKQHYPTWKVELGYRAAGQLNFPRRIVNTVLTVATRPAYQRFAEQVMTALKERGITAPVYILKADGGTLPIARAVDQPVETIFSGPAASTMGVLALTSPKQTSVVVDIGGTTTDLALILAGEPLLSSKGARVKNWLTQVRAFAVKSVPLGGDSLVQYRDHQLLVGPHRVGVASCLGGPAPTPTDALRVLGLTDIGNLEAARLSLERIARQLGLSVEATAQEIVQRVTKQLVEEINQMFLAWEQEPAYRVWELMQKEKVRPENVVGVGGSSPSLIPLVAEQLNCRGIIPPHAEVANAIGAAVARPTLSISLRVDTERERYSVAETGQEEKLPNAKRFFIEEANELGRQLLRERAAALGITEYADEMEIIHSEVFNMVRGWHTVGRLFDVTVQIAPGLIANWQAGGVEGV